MENNNNDEKRWRLMQHHLGYTDDEMAMFRNDPRNADVLSKAAGLLNKTIVIEVIESHGCNSRHKVGDKIYLDGIGNLLTKQCPNKVCILALNAATSMVFTISELYYAGVDPNEMRFKRVGCLDVDVKCGGWGHIVMEFSVTDRNET